MATNKQQSAIGEIDGFLVRSFTGIGIGVVAAWVFISSVRASHSSRLGRLDLHAVVGGSALVAAAKRDWRGLAIGLMLLIPALLNLGMAEAVGVRDCQSTRPKHSSTN